MTEIVTRDSFPLELTFSVLLLLSTEEILC